MTPLQTRRRHHRAHTNIYNLLDENEKDQEKQWQYTRIMKNKKAQKEKIYNRRSRKYNGKVKSIDANTKKEI